MLGSWTAQGTLKTTLQSCRKRARARGHIRLFIRNGERSTEVSIKTKHRKVESP
jgi:hypothetical protein